MEKMSSVELLIPPANILFQTSSVPVSSSNQSGMSASATNPQQSISNTSATPVSISINNPSSANQHPIPHLILSPPYTSGVTTLTVHGQQASSSNSLNYVHKIINHGLVDIFEKHFSYAVNNFTHCSIKIYEILVKYLEGYYMSQYLVSGGGSALSSDDAFANVGQVIQNANQGSALNLLSSNHLQQQMNPKFFNYYATIRRDIFEFLLRIRSDTENRVLLINKSNRRTFQRSKYLLLNLRLVQKTFIFF
jgi:hypothetical protein